jgi:hypothetical protein
MSVCSFLGGVSSGKGNFAGRGRKTKSAAAGRSKASCQGGGVAGCVYAKLRRRQRWRRLALRFTSFVPTPSDGGKISRNQQDESAEWAPAQGGERRSALPGASLQKNRAA